MKKRGHTYDGTTLDVQGMYWVEALLGGAVLGGTSVLT